MASDSTVAIPADSDAFASAPTEPGVTSEATSGAPDETLIFSDLDTDPVSGPAPVDAIYTDEATSEEDFASDPLAQVEPDDLAVGAVLDPASGRDFDVSSSDLGDPLEGTETTLEAAEEELSSPWSVEAPALEEGKVLPEPSPEAAPEPALDPILAPQEDAPAFSTPSAPDLSPLVREQLHEALEKVAWEAFSEVTEQIVKQALERIETVAWEVIPQMAEALIREEIRKFKGEDD
jgi:hypothetical protein